MPSINNIKVTIGGAESPAGTEAEREFVVPIRAVPTVDNQAEKAVDPAIIGRNMDAGEYTVAENVSGSLPIIPRAVGGFAQLLKSLLGTEDTPVQVGAMIRIRYTGSEVSCVLGADTSGDELTSDVGDVGEESGDTNFGTAGVIDLTVSAFDTVGELVAAIHAYADYECEKIFGADAVDAANIVSVTSVQGASTWAYFLFTSAASGAYAHIFTADLTDTERPTYSIQKDGFQDNYLYDGCVVDTLSLAAALKGMIEGEAGVLGMDETDSQEASELSLEDAYPLIFHTGSFALAENDYTYLRNINLQIANNHNAEGYGLGSVERLYHQKGKLDITGDFQLRLDATSQAERAKVFANTLAALSFYFTGQTIAESVPEMMLIELPFCQYSAFEHPENAGVLDAKINFKAIYPGGTIYNEPIKVILVTEDSGSY